MGPLSLSGKGANGWGGLTLMLEYLENGKRYDVGLNGGPIGKHPCAIDWRRHIYSPMTLKGQSLHRNIYAVPYMAETHTFYLLVK